MSKRFLLDTHVFVWSMLIHRRLNNEVKNLITDPHNTVFVSVATIWEIMIKKKLKKIRVPNDVEKEMKKAGFYILPITIPHVLPIEKMPLYHSDPFDRLLIAQAKVENLTIITHDRQIWKYDVDVLKV